MYWLRMYTFQGRKVYVEVDSSGEILVHNGLVRVRYQKHDERCYNMRMGEFSPINGEEIYEEEVSGGEVKKAGKKKGVVDLEEMEEVAVGEGDIVIYTDGGAVPNPGRGGYGVVMVSEHHRLEVWSYLGENVTNNVAELTAILDGLRRVKKRDMRVILYSDSAYALDVCLGRKKAKANKALIEEIQSEMLKFRDLRLCKVKGHAGVALNEHVDMLATHAIESGESGENRVIGEGPLEKKIVMGKSDNIIEI